IEPGSKRCPTLVVAIERPPRAQHRVLQQVLGVVHRAEHPIAVGEELAPIGISALLKVGRRDRHCYIPRTQVCHLSKTYVLREGSGLIVAMMSPPRVRMYP